MQKRGIPALSDATMIRCSGKRVEGGAAARVIRDKTDIHIYTQYVCACVCVCTENGLPG